jgi:hypothetical protein
MNQRPKTRKRQKAENADRETAKIKLGELCVREVSRLTREQLSEILGMMKAFLYCQEGDKKRERGGELVRKRRSCSP